jgi:uncharacterized protein (DUF1501 family)
MSRIHFIKRRDFLKAGACTLAAGGFSTVLPQMNLMSTALAQATTGYKALVCIFLDGGNDAWNMLIPTDAAANSTYRGTTQSPYLWYQQSRGGLYQGNSASLAFPPPGQGGAGTPFLPGVLPLNDPLLGPNAFGVNPFAAPLQSIFNLGARKLAFLANAGPLVQPIRKSGFNSTPRPPQLYSHNDQTSLWQIGSGNSVSNPNGWGGMIAGRTATSNLLGLPPAISIAGQTRFLVGLTPGGQSVFPYRLSTSATNPATSLNNYGTVTSAGGVATRSFNASNVERARFNALQDMINEAYPHAFSNEFGDIVDRSLRLSEVINAQIANIPSGAVGSPEAAFSAAIAAFPNTGIGNQLRQVARLIRISKLPQGSGGAIAANRQVFFARTGGYDTHDGQIQNATQALGHHRLLSELTNAMSAFNTAMAALSTVNGFNGVYDEVLTVVISEFARTINSNGNGTDHAWGSVSTMMGGPLTGPQVVGQFPPQILGYTEGAGNTLPAYMGGECFNRGEFLPRIATDQIAATCARWMGVQDADIPLLFPNIDNFANAPVGAPLSFRSRIIPGLLTGVS